MYGQQQQMTTQTYTVHGTIKDLTGAVIGGLPLLDNGKYTGAVTDVNGDFEITLSSGSHTLTLGKYYDLRLFLKIVDGGPNPDNVELRVDPSLAYSDITFPRPSLLPKPPYPAAAMATRTRGEIIVTVKIDKDGNVTSAEIEHGHPLLKTASLAAAKSARFEPSSEIERKARLTYVFIDCFPRPRDSVGRYSNTYRIELVAECQIDY